MAVSRFQSVNDIVNHVAIECGLTAVTDVFASNDPAFTRLTFLLTTCVQELMENYPWQIINRTFSYTTGAAENGPLDLPDDFGYMIPQTGWERSGNVPLLGPLSAQGWTYLLGRDLVSSTIYASFRLDQNKLEIFPSTPMPALAEITFEYISLNLIQITAAPTTYTDTAETAADIVQFPPNLIKRMLRMKYLEATGFDSTKASDDYYDTVMSWQGRDNSSPILSATSNRTGILYLDNFRSVPDSGFGS
tara:strand:+ start:536 stop:1279 length:744 start_codon:yes stop_codon:yes gene_type:complete